MKKKISILSILLITTCLIFSTTAVAHPTSQEGILAQFHIEEYDIYAIGSEKIGWGINEMHHSAGTTITYQIDSSVPSNVRNMITTAASLWYNAANISFIESTNATGTITMNSSLPNGVFASTRILGVDDNGHLTSWVISLKPNICTTTTVAHEFGHAIGIVDLYDSINIDKLMYGFGDIGTATAPTSSDIWGARVITGQHVNHTWGYKYYGISAYGNLHQKYCTTCQGLSEVVESCTYTTGGSNPLCTKCGIPKGVQPYSNNNQTQMK